MQPWLFPHQAVCINEPTCPRFKLIKSLHKQLASHQLLNDCRSLHVHWLLITGLRHKVKKSCGYKCATHTVESARLLSRNWLTGRKKVRKTKRGRDGSRPPSRTDGRQLVGHHNRLPLYDTYSGGASADESKWAVKCYSMLDTFLSPGLLSCARRAQHTLSLMKVGAENLWKKRRRRCETESLQSRMFVHSNYHC